MVDLSVLDLAYIGEGFTPADALEQAGAVSEAAAAEEAAAEEVVDEAAAG